MLIHYEIELTAYSLVLNGRSGQRSLGLGFRGIWASNIRKYARERKALQQRQKPNMHHLPRFCNQCPFKIWRLLWPRSGERLFGTIIGRVVANKFMRKTLTHSTVTTQSNMLITLILSGGPGDDCDYMLPVAFRHRKIRSCDLLEQRGYGALPAVPRSTRAQ